MFETSKFKILLKIGYETFAFSNSFFASLSETAVFIKDVPEVIQNEWDLFKEEIIEEAARIEEIDKKGTPFQDISENKVDVGADADQNTIDRIREKISEITHQIEGIN